MKRNLLLIIYICISSLAFSQLSLTVNKQDISCYGLANGSATVIASGGTPAYTYTWLPGGQTTSSISNLAPGQYTVLVSDAASATSSYPFAISEPSQLSVSTQINYDCHNSNFCDNEAAVTISGGTPPFSYAWSTGAVAQSTIGALCFGNSYSVQATDANGCTDTTSFLIDYNSIVVTETHTTTTCNGLCNGAISFSVTGGSGSYSYSLSTSSWTGFPVSSLDQYSLCAGGYTLIALDNTSGCIGVTAVYIPVPNNAMPNATVTSTSYDETCYLTSDGIIDVNVTGTNPGPFTYVWSNGATTQNIYNLSSGIYTIAIIDNNSNCFVLCDTISSIGVNCGTISGHVFIDANSDCINNSGDYSFNNMPIIINPGNRLGYTNPQGNYTVSNLPYGTYSITLNPTNSNISPTCATTITTLVNSSSPGSMNNDLSVAFNSATQPDMSVYIGSMGIVPGFSCSVGYGVQNLNAVNSNGQFKVTLPSLYITNLISASPGIYTISGDTIIWSFSNLNYFNYAPFAVYFNVPINAPLGSIFTSCAYVETSVPDANYANNTNCYTGLVTGAFDPNDKTVSPVGFGASGDIPASVTELTYLIRFQNTGNGPAVNIVVKDTLSSNLDILTLEMLSASHNYNIDILNGNILRWKFNNIMLPDSNSNEAASHGYIQYRIKRNNNNTPGTQIKNTAYIYFDFNEPVVTNTAVNTIELLTGIQSFSKDNELAIYPNPAKEILNIDLGTANENAIIKIYNAIGELVLTEDLETQNSSLNIHHFPSGIYFCRILVKGIIVNTNKVVIIR